MNLSNGLLNLTNWLGNVIMPTMAGLFAAAAIYRFSKAHPYSHLGYAALASLMCSGLLRAMESFSNQASWNNPDRYWISVLTLVNWVGNVLLPLYGAGQVVLAVVHFAGLLERMTIGEAWVRNLVAAMCCFGLSGLLRLGEFWIQHGTATPSMPDFIRSGVASAMNSNSSPAVPASNASSNGSSDKRDLAATMSGRSDRHGSSYRPHSVTQVVSFNVGRALGRAAGRNNAENN